MKKLFYKLFIAALPLLIITALYIYADPFMVVRHHDDAGRKHLEINEDYDRTETFIKENGAKKYDSYVFGSSRAALFHGPHLEKLFGSDKIFKYTVVFETLFGAEKKLSFLNKQGAQIKNVLLAIDPQFLAAAENSKGHLFKKHPLLSGEGELDFQLANYIDIYSTDFIQSYIKLLKTPAPPAVQVGIKATTDPYLRNDGLIARNRDSFYIARKKEFYPRSGKLEYAKTVIGPAQKALLDSIRNIFALQHTNYIIVIHPLYDQKKMSIEDMNLLYSLFDKNKIYDFSGINEYTESIYNYYEAAHYRTFIAEKVMDSIYNKRHQQ